MPATVTNAKQAELITTWLRRVGAQCDTDVRADNLGRGAAKTWAEMKAAGMLVQAGTHIYPGPERPLWTLA